LLTRLLIKYLDDAIGKSINLFALIWILVFLMIFSIALVNPVIPYLVDEFLVEEAAVVAMIGLLNSLFNLAKTLANIPGGVLADRLGKRKLIAISFLILPFSFLLYYFSDNCYYLIAGQLISGIALGLSIPAISAIVADIVPRATLSTAYGIFNLSWTLGQIPSPMLGGFLSEVMGLRMPFLAALLVSLPCLALSLKLRSSEEKGIEQALSQDSLGEVDSFAKKSYKRVLMLFCGIEALNGFGNGILTTLFIVYPLYVLGVSAFEMGVIFSIGWGVATALAQVPGGRLADKFGEKPLILACVLMTIPLLILLPLTRTLASFIIVLGVLCIVGNLSIPAYSSWLATSLPSSKRGTGFGATSAAFGIGLIIGPIIGSILWNLFQFQAIIPFAASAIMFLLTIPLIKAIK